MGTAISMSNGRVYTLVFCAGLLACSSAFAECDFDDFPVPDDMTVASIAEHLQWNNQPMNVKAFSLNLPAGVVSTFYENHWKGEVDRTEFGEWQQILHINDECLMMVQVKDHPGGSTGRLMLVNPPDQDLATRVLGSGVPIPPDAVVVTDMLSEDDFRDGQLVMLASPDTLEENLSWYQSEMQRTGWTSNRRAQQQNDATLLYSKGSEQMSIVFLRHKEYTQILLNKMNR